MFYGPSTASGESFIRAAESCGLRIVRSSYDETCDHADVFAEAKLIPVIIFGTDLAKRVLRSKRAAHPAPVMVIAEDHDAGVVSEILDAGADEVFRPPFCGSEIAARARAIFRRISGTVSSEVRIGDLQVAMDRGEVFVSGQPVRVSATESEIIGILASNHPRKISRGHIYDVLYGLESDPPQTKVIDVHISNLRKKLAAADMLGRNFIGSISGVGYGIIAA